jgi:hypothetical protein
LSNYGSLNFFRLMLLDFTTDVNASIAHFLINLKVNVQKTNERGVKMSYIIKTQNKMYDITGLGQGEGLYNVTRVELEQLLKDIEVELMNDDYDTNGNYTKGA